MLTQGEDRERKDQRRLQIALLIGVVLSAMVCFVVSNKLANDATRHWADVGRAAGTNRHAARQAGDRARTSGETRKV